MRAQHGAGTELPRRETYVTQQDKLREAREKLTRNIADWRKQVAALLPKFRDRNQARTVLSVVTETFVDNLLDVLFTGGRRFE